MNYSKVNNDDLNIKAHLDASLDRISMSEDLIKRTLKAIHLQTPESAENTGVAEDIGDRSKRNREKKTVLPNKYIYGFARVAAVVLIVAAGYAMLRNFGGMKKDSVNMDTSMEMTANSAAPEHPAAFDDGAGVKEDEMFKAATDDFDLASAERAEKSGSISEDEDANMISLALPNNIALTAALSVRDIFVSEPEQIQSLTITDENADYIILTSREAIKGLYTVLDKYRFETAAAGNEAEVRSFKITAIQEDESTYTMSVGSNIVIDYITEETAGQGQYEVTNIELLLDDLQSFYSSNK